MLSTTNLQKTNDNAIIYDLIESKLKNLDLNKINTCPLYLENRHNTLYPCPYLNDYKYLLILSKKTKKHKIHYICMECSFVRVLSPDLVGHIGIKHQCKNCKIKSMNEKIFNDFIIQFCKNIYGKNIHDFLELQYNPINLKKKRYDVYIRPLDLYIEVDDQSHIYSNITKNSDIIKTKYVRDHKSKLLRVSIKNKKFDINAVTTILNKIINRENNNEWFYEC